MTAKLTYFDLTGLGEPVRLMLSVAGIPFEDVRLNKQEWAALKPTLPYDQLPMLEIHGETLFQSRAICRYIARKAALAGSNDLEAALADMTVDAMDDMRAQIVKHYYVPDSEEREKALAQAVNTVLPNYLNRLEIQAGRNKGFLVGGKISWADVMLVAYIDYLGHILSLDILAKYPLLAEIFAEVTSLKGIAKWMENRPKQVADTRSLFM